jgi:hypothetical protein
VPFAGAASGVTLSGGALDTFDPNALEVDLVQISRQCGTEVAICSFIASNSVCLKASTASGSVPATTSFGLPFAPAPSAFVVNAIPVEDRQVGPELTDEVGDALVQASARCRADR